MACKTSASDAHASGSTFHVHDLSMLYRSTNSVTKKKNTHKWFIKIKDNFNFEFKTPLFTITETQSTLMTEIGQPAYRY